MHRSSLLLAFLLSAPAVSAGAAEFSWCRGIKDYPDAELFAAKVPEYPQAYRNRPIKIDGEWTFNHPIADVWRAYYGTALSRVWRSNSVKYYFATRPGSMDRIDEARWPGLFKGLRFFLNIEGMVTGLFCHFGMGVEVTEIVPERLIKFEYLDFSPPYGEQWIEFEATPNGNTIVRHKTRYLGKDWLIDNFYASYHADAIPQLHKNAQRLLNGPR
ncbi:MAG: hypothetical protein HY078_01485 [Elusimicrobia bacterium]|nr:hypothetical protein [Elusimicrobiota bacterium]